LIALSIVLLPLSLLIGSSGCFIASVMSLCSGLVILSIGFLAVAISPYRRTIETRSYAVTVQAASIPGRVATNTDEASQ
jgi:hypothetical protein